MLRLQMSYDAFASKHVAKDKESDESEKMFSCQICTSLTAIPRPMHWISSELRSQVAQGPVSTRVGDRLGRPQGAVSILHLLLGRRWRREDGGVALGVWLEGGAAASASL